MTVMMVINDDVKVENTYWQRCHTYVPQLAAYLGTYYVNRLKQVRCSLHEPSYCRCPGCRQNTACHALMLDNLLV